MTIKGRATPACAACKYQRRKCSPSCPLAPYFPATQHKTFQNVHRLFGVSNVTHTLESLQTRDEREDAMKSIIFEADMRHRFPVLGCCAIITHLRLQLHLALNELLHVHAQLESCRAKFGPCTVLNDKEFVPFELNNNLFLLDDLHEVKPLWGLDGLNYNLNTSQAQMDGFGLHCPQHHNFITRSDSSSLDDQTLHENEARPGC